MMPGRPQAQRHPGRQQPGLVFTQTVPPDTRTHKPHHLGDSVAPGTRASPATQQPGSRTPTSALVSQTASGRTKQPGWKTPREGFVCSFDVRAFLAAREATLKPFFFPLSPRVLVASYGALAAAGLLLSCSGDSDGRAPRTGAGSRAGCSVPPQLPRWQGRPWQLHYGRTFWIQTAAQPPVSGGPLDHPCLLHRAVTDTAPSTRLLLPVSVFPSAQDISLFLPRHHPTRPCPSPFRPSGGQSERGRGSTSGQSPARPLCCHACDASPRRARP